MAAVDVTSTSGEKKPPTAHAGEVTTDGATAQQSDAETVTEDDVTDDDTPPLTAPDILQPPLELHSGRKLAQRYRLEECITRLDGFSSWRAVDEKLRRAVGVHVLPATHTRARSVLAAARSAALLGDPRFVQVLDAVEEDELVYVVHEWLPDAVSLSTVLSAGPLEPHEACQLVGQLSQAMAAAHREGLAHLRLTPGAVLRTGSGQYRIRGLAVGAALRGISAEQPQRTDTKAIGALLYAALTQRWPYSEDAYGLTGVFGLTKGTLVPPDQVRAGVHRGLSELAMRALVNDGATASRQEQPCPTPESLAKAVAAMPPIRPPEPTFPAASLYHRSTYQSPHHAANVSHAAVPAPTLPGRTGNILKWGVSALLIAALGLGSWQLADVLVKGDEPAQRPEQSQAEPEGGAGDKAGTGKPLAIVQAKDFDPYSDGEENPESVSRVHDSSPSTSWHTQNYYGRADFGGLKEGLGLILDLGKPQQVSSVKVSFLGDTTANLLSAPRNSPTMPTTLQGFDQLASASGTNLTLEPKTPITTRYVLVWLTELPSVGNGYRGQITDIKVTG